MKERITAESVEMYGIGKSDQYRTVNELFERSKPTSDYYTMLILSSLIIIFGLLLDVSAIVIGGMLVTPMLSPILTIGLSLSVGELKGVVAPLRLVGISALIIFVMAMLFGFFFDGDARDFLLEDTLRSAALYFFVALTAGIVSALAWARKELADVLAGTAIAVAVVPPIALMGIWLARLGEIGAGQHAQFFLVVFILNFLGIVVGSTGVFSILKFYKVERHVESKIEELEEATHLKDNPTARVK